MTWKYLHKVNESCWKLDHRVTPEVSAMFSAMVSRLPLGGIEARYRQVVEAVAQERCRELLEDRKTGLEAVGIAVENNPLHPDAVSWSTLPERVRDDLRAQAEDKLTEYPLHPKVQEFFDKFVGQYGHGSIKELTGQPAIFWEGISPWNAYLSFDNPLVSGQESSTRAVRHKNWPMCREAYVVESTLYEDVEMTHTIDWGDASGVIVEEAEITFESRGEQPPKEQLDVVVDVHKPHPELGALHEAWLEVFEAEVEAWKVELRRGCDTCLGIGSTHKTHPLCKDCEGTGKKYPWIKDPQAFRPALDRARWAIPSTIATACSHTGNLRTMSRVVADGMAFTDQHCEDCNGAGATFELQGEFKCEHCTRGVIKSKVWTDIAEAYDAALPGMAGMGMKEAVVGKETPLPGHLKIGFVKPKEEVTVIAQETYPFHTLQLAEKAYVREGRNYIDPMWNQLVQVHIEFQCSWAVARDWHRHRTAYPWTMDIVSEGARFHFHPAYQHISLHALQDVGKHEATESRAHNLMRKSFLLFAKFREAGDMEKAILCLPFGSLVSMRTTLGLRDAIYMLELRAFAHGANAEYRHQALTALQMLRRQLPDSVIDAIGEFPDVKDEDLQRVW